MVQMQFVILAVTLVVGFLHYTNKRHFEQLNGVHSIRMQILERRNSGAYLMAAIAQATNIEAFYLLTADHLYVAYLFTFLCCVLALYGMYCIDYKPYRLAGILTVLSCASVIT